MSVLPSFALGNDTTAKWQLVRFALALGPGLTASADLRGTVGGEA